jgi:hypothetical protein
VDGSHDVSRVIWGQSVFRACLACELAHAFCPQYGAEAFVIGLMLDCGVPLQVKLLGSRFGKIYEDRPPPSELFALESKTLPFTHVDTAAALMRRWKMPDLLAKPIERHHTPPPEGAGGRDPVQMLHRLAYYVGSVDLDDAGEPVAGAPEEGVASRVMGVRPADLESTIKVATAEYHATSQLFGDIADAVANADDLADRLHQQLISAMDATLERSFRKETTGIPQAFSVGGQEVEIEIEHDGLATAYLIDSHGERLLSQRLPLSGENTDAVFDVFGLHPEPGDDSGDLLQYLRSLAA